MHSGAPLLPDPRLPDPRLPQDRRPAERPPRRGYLGELFEGATYRHLLYFVLATPLSVLSGVALCLALVGVPLLLVLLGVPLLLLGGWCLGLLARLDRRLGTALLRLPLARPAALRPSGFWARVRARLGETNTYKVMLYSVLKLPYMALATSWLLLTLGGGALMIALPFLLPLYPELNIPVMVGERTFELGPYSAALLGACGFFLLLLGVSGLNLLARIWMIVSYGLLTDYGENASAVREVAALREVAATVAYAGSLEETLGRLLRRAQGATSARSVRLGVGEHSALSGPPFSVPGSLQATNRGRDTLSPLRNEQGGDGQLLSLAVSSRGEVLGTLEAVYDHAPSVREMQFWAAVADQAAVSADIARLIDQAQTRGSEQERARLARELHDSVAQALYGVSLATRTARALIEKNPVRASESLDFAVSLADGASAEMKALLFALRPDALEEGGLVAALSRLAEMLRLRYSLDVSFEAPAEPPLDIAAKGTLYRVAQEATHNAVKHARARHLTLRLVPLGEGWRLTVSDDGAGFDPSATRPGSLGLKSMHERAALIGAALGLRSAPGVGTTLELWVPLPDTSLVTGPVLGAQA
ncbi:sensor histidine kinase [Deinococcus sp.]|uniref:sensor histidine kinase n=1 Tax=Deinococcus sp. TaxID=47478 RepID=UPI0025D4F736|nr:sensor histidine kinase [Deinococcus sp.]